MARNTNNNDDSLLRQTKGQIDGSDTDNDLSIEYLKSIDDTLQAILSRSGGMSQSAARDYTKGDRGQFGQQYEDNWGLGGRGRKNIFGKGRPQSFEDGINEALLEGLLGSDFKDKIGKGLNDFAKSLGMNIQDIPGQFGKRLAQDAMSAFKKTSVGKTASEYVGKARNKAASWVKDTVAPDLRGYLKGDISAKDILKKGGNSLSGSLGKASKAATNIGGKLQGMAGAGAKGKLAQVAGGLATKAGGALSTASAGLGAGTLAGAGKALAALGPYALIAGAAILVVYKAFKALSPAIEGAKKMFKALKAAGQRYSESRKKNVELETKRLAEDVESMVRAPFDILKDAAQKLYDAWDSNLRIITATQGYTKEDLQDLMSSYAERVRSEGLTKEISAADLTSNLSKVLESGLSGQIAEEFAYIATKLNAAIPTQDFFGYASTYASIAANAMKDGKSQSQAIGEANAQLEEFANNILYAGRQLTGGFSTGLKDAQSLFESSVKIAQASKTNNSGEIGGVLTAVSGIVGAIAPDLASSITDAIVKASTGGNSEDVVALRSLAGINASNTEFLKQLSKNPQKVFSTLFKNLGRMQHMADDAYMEVGEGLSSVFGLSLDAFARVDFDYLASAISNMNVSSASLDENLKLLSEGQTTLTAEQLRNQQINQYMWEQGLAYVLDNEVARSIQEHMWEEQIARDLMEATYGVELHGAALEFLESIKSTVNNIVNLLNPFAWVNKIANAVNTAREAAAQEADVSQLLELGKVGNGNPIDLYRLTTRNVNLDLVPNIVNLMGGFSAYETAHAVTKAWNLAGNLGATSMDAAGMIRNGIRSTVINGLNRSIVSDIKDVLGLGITSQYKWKDIRKSTATAYSTRFSSVSTTPTAAAVPSGSSVAKESLAVTKFREIADEKFIEDMVKSGKQYKDWETEAKRRGIADLDKTMEDAEVTKSQIQSMFQASQAQQGAEMKEAMMNDEQDFRDQGRDFWTITKQYWIDQYNRLGDIHTETQTLSDLVRSVLSGQTAFFKTANSKWDTFHKQWVDYFINHTYYTERAGIDYNEIKRRESEKQGDAIYALADALVNGVTDIKDPTVQTNALLAQILQIVSAIMQQNNTTKAGSGIIDTLSAMALGGTI